MKKLIPLLIVFFILISCSEDNGSIEGKIADVKKGTEIGKFIYILLIKIIYDIVGLEFV